VNNILICVVLQVLAIVCVSATISASDAPESGKDGNMSQNIDYREVPTAFAHNDPEVTAMFNRLNKLGRAVSSGDILKLNDLILDAFHQNDEAKAPGPPHVEVQVDIKDDNIVAINVTDRKTEDYLRIDFRSDGTPVAYTEHLGEERIIRRLEIRDDVTPKLMTTYSTADGALKAKGRRIAWNREGEIESDEMIP